MERREGKVVGTCASCGDPVIDESTPDLARVTMDNQGRLYCCAKCLWRALYIGPLVGKNGAVHTDS